MSFESLQLFHFRKKESHVESLQLQAKCQGTKRSCDELDANRVAPNVRPVGCKKA